MKTCGPMQQQLELLTTWQPVCTEVLESIEHEAKALGKTGKYPYRAIDLFCGTGSFLRVV